MIQATQELRFNFLKQSDGSLGTYIYVCKGEKFYFLITYFDCYCIMEIKGITDSRWNYRF